MKKIIFISFLFIYQTIHAQKITHREESEVGVSILSSTVPMQLEPYLFSVNAFAIIPKDTAAEDMYALSFFYKTPKEITLDTTAEVELRFSDGTLFTFNQVRNELEPTAKDSLISFQCLVSYKCLSRMTKMPVSDINFITPLYTINIEIEDKIKLFLPNLARLILDKANEEYVDILNFERSKYATPIAFDPSNNQKLDQKYFGKYSGEWYVGEYLYNFDLYLKSDTSYIVWQIINDPNESKPYRIKTQVLNIRPFTDPYTLIMDVCYESDKPDYTDGRRTFYLKLSEDEKMLYGETWVWGQPFGKMYGVKRKIY